MNKLKKPYALTDRDLEERYENMLDEVYGLVSIGGYKYSTSRALKEVDPTAFRCGFSDWLDSEIGETLEEDGGNYYDKDDWDSYVEENDDDE
jgi:hypothetical protein